MDSKKQDEAALSAQHAQEIIQLQVVYQVKQNLPTATFSYFHRCLCRPGPAESDNGTDGWIAEDSESDNGTEGRTTEDSETEWASGNRAQIWLNA